MSVYVCLYVCERFTYVLWKNKFINCSTNL